MLTKTLPLIAVFALAAPLAGCGGDNDNNGGGATKTTSTPTPAATPSRSLSIRMDEFSFDPKDAVASAGRVTISAPNVGKAEHELVLLKTDADPAALPTKNGEVDESTSVGEIADVPPGETKRATFSMKPGKYVMVCALPGHYEAGMYGSLTVR